MGSERDTEVVLEARGLSKSYGKTVSVNELSFKLQKGQVVGLIGPNGAGKTTTIKCLAGLAKANSGKLYLNGQLLPENNDQRNAISFVFEIDALPTDMSVKRFLSSEAAALGLGKEQVNHAISAVSLTDLQNRFISSLSMGNRRRVSLAATLLSQSDVIVLDEPTNGLDIAGLRFVRDLISQYRSQGKSVLFSSHTLSEVEKVVDKVLVINHGKKLFEGDIPSMVSSVAARSLEEAYELVLAKEAY
jgi:ABC-2 type transport system ATP-binding protein